MLGEKERFYILGQKISGNRACVMLQILGTCYKISLENSKLFWRYIETQIGELGWEKGRFKLLHFTNTTISFTLHPSLLYATIKFLREMKLSAFQLTGVCSRKANENLQIKTATRQFLIWRKSYIPYYLYWHPSKKFHTEEVKYWRRVLPWNTFLRS